MADKNFCPPEGVLDQVEKQSRDKEEQQCCHQGPGEDLADSAFAGLAAADGAFDRFDGDHVFARGALAKLHKAAPG